MLKRLSAFAGTVAVALAVLVAPAATAVSADDFVTPHDGTCDLAAAGLGHGTPGDEFLIHTGKQLAEMDDCDQRSFSITDAVGNGTDITFTSEHAFGVGQLVNISGMNPESFNIEAARIISVTATSFTVRGTTTDTFNSGGNAEEEHTYFSLESDIDLSSGNDSWNNIDSAVITGAVGDGTSITYTAVNSFEVGQSIEIFGIKPLTFSVGTAEVTAADGNSFTISNGAQDTYVSGGVAYSQGWVSNRLTGIDFNGNGHTIDGLTLHRNENEQGLFGNVQSAKIYNFDMTNVEISNGGMQPAQYVGGVAGTASDVTFADINVSGMVTGRRNYAGLLAGAAFNSNVYDIHTDGTVGLLKPQNIMPNDWNDRPAYVGGVVGSYGGNAEDISSDADVYGNMTTGVEGETYSLGRSTGGVFGDFEGNARGVVGTGDVNGGQYTGGVFGYACCGEISNSYATGSVTVVNEYAGWDPQGVGGFVGAYGCCGILRDSYSTGDVIVINNVDIRSPENIGGFAGTNWCCAIWKNNYSTGDVTVTTIEARPAYSVGGLIGVYDCCNAMENVHSTGDVSVNFGYRVGGLIGWSDSSEVSLFNSYATGDVTVGSRGEANVGGLIGQTDYDILIRDSYATGDVTVTPFAEGDVANNVGGFIGYSKRGPVTIHDSFYRGTVTGSTWVGGFIGKSAQAITEIHTSYVSAVVNATAANPRVDAAVNGYYTDLFDTSIWDSTVAGAVTSDMWDNAKTSAQLKTASTLTGLGWDLEESWAIDAAVNDGFPYLLKALDSVSDLPAATVTWAPNTSVKTNTVTPSALATSNSSGAITYAVTNAGATGCTVNSSTGKLHFAAAGTCVITATAAADANYSAGSTSVTFTVKSANCPAVSLGSVSFAPGSSTLTKASRKQVDAAVKLIVAKGCGSVAVNGLGASTKLAKSRAFTVKNAIMARLSVKGVAVTFHTTWAGGKRVNAVKLVGRNG